MPTIDHAWENQQLRALTLWFGKRYQFDPSAPGVESTVTSVSPMSTQGQMLLTFQNLLDEQVEPHEAAETIATLVLADDAPVHAWAWMTGVVCTAAETWQRSSSIRLIDMLIALAKLPHTLPYHPTFGRDSTAAEAADTRFAQLPGLGYMLHENFQGPRQYLHRLNTVALQARRAARDRWRTLTFFIATLTHHALSGSLPVGANFVSRAPWLMAHALEYTNPFDQAVEEDDQGTVPYMRMGDPAMLWLPACAEWILVVGKQTIITSLNSQREATPGRLWAAKNGGHEVGVDRWRFWQQRLYELSDAAESTLLDRDIKTACFKAAEVIKTLLEAEVSEQDIGQMRHLQVERHDA